MAGAQLNTVTFRVAVTVAVLWLLVATIIGAMNYRAVQPYEWTAGYQEAAQRCSEDQLGTAASGEFAYRRPTSQEIDSCIGSARRLFSAFENDEKNRALFRGTIRALIPALAVLIIGAFHGIVISKLRAVWRAYVSWLKGRPDQT